MGAPGEEFSLHRGASKGHEAKGPETFQLTDLGNLLEGTNVIAVELRNTVLTSSDLSFIPRVVAPPPPPPLGGRFIRGDCNGDGTVQGEIMDALFLLRFNFLLGDPPPCDAACDSNGDGTFDGKVSDALFTLRYNFLGGPAPGAPFPSCGPLQSPADESLGCETAAPICR